MAKKRFNSKSYLWLASTISRSPYACIFDGALMEVRLSERLFNLCSVTSKQTGGAGAGAGELRTHTADLRFSSL